ncbi:MAG: hypothetical protein ACK5X3_16725 [Pseudomonadota bacterium]
MSSDKVATLKVEIEGRLIEENLRLRDQVKAASAASVENEKAAAKYYVTPDGESFSEGECIAALVARIERLTAQVEMARDREHRLRTQLDEWREEQRLGEKDEGRHRDTHQAEHWPDFADLPINNNVPRARQHISACCDSVLMQGVDYVRAEKCVNACVGIKDPAKFVRAAEGLYWMMAVRSDLGGAAMNAALRSYQEARGNYPPIPPTAPTATAGGDGAAGMDAPAA